MLRRASVILALAVLVNGSVAFLLPSQKMSKRNCMRKGKHTKNRVAPIQVIPLELEGQLDPSKVWDVKMTFQGETKMVKVPEDSSILEAAEKEWDVPFSCRNGICTTCAARVTAGASSKKEAIHGLSGEQSENGFVLTCQTHPCGPGLEIELGMYDIVYEDQYGKYERRESERQKGKGGIFG